MGEEINTDIGKRARFVLPNNIYYSGIILGEDSIFIYIKDKLGKEVRLAKAQLVSMEVSDGN